MTGTDVVLYNEYGMEIARDTITKEKDYTDIIKDWVIYAGDRIELEETWHEEF